MGFPWVYRIGTCRWDFGLISKGKGMIPFSAAYGKQSWETIIQGQF
jgi:hypothetical protein